MFSWGGGGGNYVTAFWLTKSISKNMYQLVTRSNLYAIKHSLYGNKHTGFANPSFVAHQTWRKKVLNK